MRKQFLIINLVISASVAILPSCNKESLTDLNIPLNSVNYPIPNYLFTNVLINTPKENYSVLAQGMQYFSTYKEVPAIGDKFYSFNGTVADFGTYTGQLNTLHQLNQAIQAPQFTNERALVRILRVYTFHQLTDAAGDIPYFDAMKGEEGVLSPKYDPQRDIYLDMFKELEQAAAALDPSKTNFGAADLFY
ncbi:MAG TPA: SusD/RagB family nutrient-binding outer membrane lipoprotein, partial [Chitinophagaceae bacterium]|nr:SusD/RagB family nutrient-binding outer membrane lipoprotein [Chitinophagaceae bacterium]